jgi:hypothetical protein
VEPLLGPPGEVRPRVILMVVASILASAHPSTAAALEPRGLPRGGWRPEGVLGPTPPWPRRSGPRRTRPRPRCPLRGAGRLSCPRPPRSSP